MIWLKEALSDSGKINLGGKLPQFDALRDRYIN